MFEDDFLVVPVDRIGSLRMVVGDRCRVESQVDADGTRTLTITNEAGIICVFKGEMGFTWVMPPEVEGA